MLQGEGSWKAADIPPMRLWRVFFLEPGFKWKTLALIFQCAQVSEVLKQMSQLLLAVPPEWTQFSWMVHWFLQTAELFRDGKIECGKTNSVALVLVIFLVKDRILMWYHWSSMFDDFCDILLSGRSNCTGANWSLCYLLHINYLYGVGGDTSIWTSVLNWLQTVVDWPVLSFLQVLGNDKSSIYVRSNNHTQGVQLVFFKYMSTRSLKDENCNHPSLHPE